ncbi:MAG: YlbF family regulator [Oscillospiraceae bacterium]|jgi:cell fate (sporulation/competence/biofilm development) regulator YlbF (YheA/YmcA/DUF963 family)|nr:YlbF family regulator [Oscillospiraceae bacterium]
MTEINEVFRRTQALGEALADTRIYLDMREAEEAVDADPAVSEMLAQLNASRLALTDLMETPDADSAAVEMFAKRIDDLQKTLSNLPQVSRRQETREAFSGLIQQVNQVLSFMVTGSTGGDEASGCAGCSGGCAGCPGCGGAKG